MDINLIDTFLRYYHTLKYLKPIQIKHQLKNRLKFGRLKQGVPSGSPRIQQLPRWKFYLYNLGNCTDTSFQFINKSISFNDDIDWNFNEYGKLWTYNLNYFDFLNSQGIGKVNGIKLIDDFISNYDKIIDGKEPYPTSLRIINWVKFLSHHQISLKHINDVLYKDSYRLSRNLEYHLLANHLLENAFGLLFSSFYFQDEALYVKAKNLLISELKEQILNDGAHYELSPMYHQLMLFRVLDSIHLIKQNPWKEDNLLPFLIQTSKRMLSWLSQVTFHNGDIPLVNDSAKNINPTSNELFKYADCLNLAYELIPLNESGYRIYKSNTYEAFCDVANIIPSYQPGHSHADTFNFLVHINDQPFIAESGTTTYELNERRLFERSTMAHNTVTVRSQNSCNVWSAFRMAKRAEVDIIHDDTYYLKAKHNGYRPVVHTRAWKFANDKIEISDQLTRETEGHSYIHFHPNVNITIIDKNGISVAGKNILFENARNIEIESYEYAEEFNKTEIAQCLKIHFKETLKTTIYINQ